MEEKKMCKIFRASKRQIKFFGSAISSILQQNSPIHWQFTMYCKSNYTTVFKSLRHVFSPPKKQGCIKIVKSNSKNVGVDIRRHIALLCLGMQRLTGFTINHALKRHG